MDDRLRPNSFWPRLRAALDDVPEDARTPPADARVGAVLVLLQDTDDGPKVVLTRRRRDLRSHPGQISFAGGRLDPGETIHQAALREAQEEIGLRADSVEVIGSGPTFYIPPSRFWVVPVLARWVAPHELTENPWEVDEVLHVPLAQLLDPTRWRHAPLSLRGSTWAWQLDDDLLWGATAMVMSLLLDVAVEQWNRGATPESLGDDLVVRPWESAPAWERRARLEGDLPAVEQAVLPHVTAAQQRAARSWADARGYGAVHRAEHAGRAVAHTVRRLRGGDTAGVAVTVLAGPSSNGAGGLAAARLLATAGAEVNVLTVGAPRFPEQTHALRDAGIRVRSVGPDGLDRAGPPGDVVVDAMLGIGADPPLRDLPEVAARWLRRYDVPVIALDLPSGVSADVGLQGPCITADVTVVLGLPTLALKEAIVQPYVGDTYLADVGLPFEAWRAAGVRPPTPSPFSRGPLVRLTAEARATDAGTPDQAAPGSD